MSETRRNIFKTSILSAFGLMTGGTIMRAAAQTSAADAYTPDVHVMTDSADPKKQWIVFRPDGTGYYYPYYFIPVPLKTDQRMEWDSGVIGLGPLTPIPGDLKITINGTAHVLHITGGKISETDLFSSGAEQFTWNEIGIQQPLKSFDVGHKRHQH
jgi:hypothetical protein